LPQPEKRKIRINTGIKNFKKTSILKISVGILQHFDKESNRKLFKPLDEMNKIGMMPADLYKTEVWKIEQSKIYNNIYKGDLRQMRQRSLCFICG